MYNNAKIQWHPGMELTNALFRNLESDLTEKQAITVRTAVFDGSIGVLPQTPLHVEGAFVKKSLEMTGLQLTALTPSGNILSIDDDLQIDVPKLEGTEWFVCVGKAKDQVREYERDGILYEEARYELRFVEADDAEALAEDVIPLKHLVLNEGSLTIDQDYILPSLGLSCDSRFEEYRNRYAETIEAIATHENMDEGDCKRTLLSLLFRLRSFSMQRTVRQFTDLLQEVAFTVKYYVTEQLGATLESCPETPRTLADDARNVPDQYNIARYLIWLDEYLKAQLEIMAQVVIVDNTIDYDQLKAELHEEIYQKLHDELYEKLQQELHDKLSTELTDNIMEAVRSLVENSLRPELFQQLYDSLHEPLRQQLYDELYNTLYSALYKPEDNERMEFMPLI